MTATKMTAGQLADVLAAHAKWCRGEAGGTRADLSGANLSRANLSRADLSRADLSGADLSGANLSRADLSGANLSRANLSGANLSGANLSGANLSGAEVAEVKGGGLALAITEILPREGEVIGWKKCCKGVLVKVRVPPDAKRSNATGRKCRAERVETLDVIGGEVGLSMYDGTTEYRVGTTTSANGWGTDRMVECDQGIHFFLTREEAKAWTG